MKISLFLVPLIGAATGWLIIAAAVKILFRPVNPAKLPFNLSFQGLVPRKRAELAAGVREIIETQLLCAVTDDDGAAPEILNNLTDTVVEAAREHVDRKIPGVIPRAVTNKIAGVVEDILRREIPRFVDNFTESVRSGRGSGPDLCRCAEAAIRGYDLGVFERKVTGSREVFLLKTGAALAGFVSGFLQLLVVWLDKA